MSGDLSKTLLQQQLTLVNHKMAETSWRKKTKKKKAVKRRLRHNQYLLGEHQKTKKKTANAELGVQSYAFIAASNHSVNQF